jgi:hypothetical protein
VSDVRLAEELEPLPPPPLEDEDFEDMEPPRGSWIRAAFARVGLKTWASTAAVALALGFLLTRGPHATPAAPTPEVAAAVTPSPAPSPNPTPIAVAPPIAVEALTPPAPAAPVEAAVAPSVDPNPTGAIEPPKKHKHKLKKPKPRIPTPPT